MTMAIMIILTSLILVVLDRGRTKAMDTRVVSNMSQIRSLAEILYSASSNSYSSLACSSFAANCTCTDSDIDTLCEDIYAEGGTNFVTQTGCSGAYCVEVTLPSGSEFCIDSSGVAGSTHVTCDASTCDCASD